MRREVLEQMSNVELNIYANALGLTFDENTEAETKIAQILDAKERTVDINIFGETFTVALRRVRDRRVDEILEKGDKLTNENGIELVNLILGEQQAEKLFALCTDDDGVEDGEALGVAIAMLISNDDLKKY